MSAIRSGLGRSGGTKLRVKNSSANGEKRTEWNPRSEPSFRREDRRDIRGDNLSSHRRSKFDVPAYNPKPSRFTRREDRLDVRDDTRDTQPRDAPRRTKYETPSPEQEPDFPRRQSKFELPRSQGSGSTMRERLGLDASSRRGRSDAIPSRISSSMRGATSSLRLDTPGEQPGADVSYGRDRQWDAEEAKRERRRDRVTEREQASPEKSRNYVTIERTTAASEYIYGRSSVLEALKSGTRQFYKLYLARGSENDPADLAPLQKRALNHGLQVIWVSHPANMSDMDKISKSRPHNGVILEASPLPKLPVAALGQAYKGKDFQVQLRSQSREDAAVNGNDTNVSNVSQFPRYPFVVMLDGIVDQGNVGGILRSAYFLGADAVVLSSHMASMNAVALKAASGAAEGIKLLSVHNTTGFLAASQENGWKVYASIAPPDSKSLIKKKHVTLTNLGQPLQSSPCILLLGGEGDGLHKDLIFAADQAVSITGQRKGSGVDSLNVSVAGGILMDAFLKQPISVATDGTVTASSGNSGLLF